MKRRLKLISCRGYWSRQRKSVINPKTGLQKKVLKKCEKKAYRFIFICHIKCTSGCETGFSGIWKMSAGEIFRTFKQVNMARQKQNTEWTQKISFFIFILHIICVSVKRLHILVTRQAWNALASYHMCKQFLLTHSGEEGERKWEFRIICVSVKRLHILATSPALLASYKKWVDKCQVYKNSAVYARWKVTRITERRFYEKEDEPENPQ